MTAMPLFASAPPGLEPVLLEEVRALGFAGAIQQPGGVAFTGGWPEVWRANLLLRGAGRVTAEIGRFRAMHLAQLDKRARRFPWGEILRDGTTVRVEVTTRASHIYHAGAAAQRIETALREDHGIAVASEAALGLRVRIDDDMVHLSVDTSGAPLHKRGYKLAVAKAPMRETLAALFLAQCGFTGTEAVVDPMCGSGTFVIEAAQIATGIAAGVQRAFAFEELASFDADAWTAMQDRAPRQTPLRFHGYDRDAGAVRMSVANADRAGVAACTVFAAQSIGDLRAPDGPPGLVIVNPPYGTRIGNPRLLYGLYAALGQSLRQGFAGWRVGMVTSDKGLAKATGLTFAPLGAPVAHGGLKVWLFQATISGSGR